MLPDSRSGGGIYSTSSTTIRKSTVSDNAAVNGAGIYAPSGMVEIIDSTLHGNAATMDGGGIHALGAIVVVHGSTISGNSAIAGGGIYGGHDLSFTTIAANIGGGVFGNGIIVHSIVAGNLNTNGQAKDVAGVISANFSLIGLGAEYLGTLAYNGGPTMTHALLPGSPAINAGDPAAIAGMDGVPLFDQRGEPFKRMHGGRIDIGAFEWQPNPLTGDYNFDGMVDTADYTLWRNTRGSTTDQRADGNADGVVDDADREIWRASFGRTYENGSSGEIDGGDWTDRVDEVFQLIGSGGFLTD